MFLSKGEKPGIPDPRVQKAELQTPRHCIRKDHRHCITPDLRPPSSRIQTGEIGVRTTHSKPFQISFLRSTGSSFLHTEDDRRQRNDRTKFHRRSLALYDERALPLCQRKHFGGGGLCPCAAIV